MKTSASLKLALSCTSMQSLLNRVILLVEFSGTPTWEQTLSPDLSTPRQDSSLSEEMGLS